MECQSLPLLIELERLDDRAPPGRSAVLRNEACREFWRRQRMEARVDRGVVLPRLRLAPFELIPVDPEGRSDPGRGVIGAPAFCLPRPEEKILMPATIANPAQTMPWRNWYSLQRWRKRAKHQLRLEPLCRICGEQGNVSPATVADHIEPHNGDWNRFLLGALQSLCRDCHARKWATEAKGGKPEIGYSREIGVDGWPIDPRHPANRKR